MNLFENLGIDWNLLIAQIINFLVLLFFLKKFIYSPILQAIDKNNKELNKGKIEREKLEKEKEAFSKYKDKVVTDTKQEAADIVNKAQSLSNDIKTKAQAEIQKERESVMRQIKFHLSEIENEKSQK